MRVQRQCQGDSETKSIKDIHHKGDEETTNNAGGATLGIKIYKIRY